MRAEHGFYDVISYDSLEPGDSLEIEHSVRSNDDGTRLAQLTHMSAEKLEALRTDSEGKEKAIFEKLCGAIGEWEEQAAQTMLLDDAIEYVKTPPVKHTSNQWEVNGDWCECSNMVYKMTYRVKEDTQFNQATRKHDIKIWVVNWDLRYNFPDHNRGGGSIAGQDNKKFTEKEKADNYVIGRIAAHAGYFEELSPPVPANIAWKFSRNHQLLPGYTVQGKEPPAMEAPAPVAVVEDTPAKDNVPTPAQGTTPAKVAGPVAAKDSITAPAAPVKEAGAAPAKEAAGSTTDYSKFIRKKPHSTGQKKKASFAR